MKRITNYKPKDFAELLGVSVKTLQRWDRDGILIAKRTPTDRRYYTYDQYLEYKGEYTITLICENESKLNEVMSYINEVGGVQIAQSIQSRNKTNSRTNTKN